MKVITFETELKTVSRLLNNNNTKELRHHLEKCLPNHRVRIYTSLNPFDKKIWDDTIF